MSYNKWINGFQIPDAPEHFVAPAKKAVPYTITPIGGPEDLKRWKAEQAVLAEARAVATAKAYAIRRATAIRMVEEQTHDLTFTEAERAEMKLRPSGKVVEDRKPKATVFTPPVHETPKKTMKEKVLGAIGQIFKNAFDSDQR